MMMNVFFLQFILGLFKTAERNFFAATKDWRGLMQSGDVALLANFWKCRENTAPLPPIKKKILLGRD